MLLPPYFLGTVIHLSKVPLKYIVKGLKPVVILLLFTVVMNLFLTRGRKHAGSFLDIYNHGERAENVGFHGSAADVSGCGIFYHDIYHNPKQSDRWN